MIALLRARHEKGKDASKGVGAAAGPPPVIKEPPELPSPQSRRQKELAWFSSIRGKGKHQQPQGQDLENRGHEQTPSAGPSQPSSYSTLSAEGPTQVQDASLESKKTIKSSASIRSLTSKSSLLGLKRRKSNSSMRKRGSEDTLNASYTFVPKGQVPPLPGGPQQIPSGSQQSTSQQVPEKRSERSLPARLQELSVAHSDGLLDEEEYRMLRAALLEKYAAQDPEEMSQGSLQLGTLGLQQESHLAPPPTRAAHVPSRTSHDRPASLRPALHDSASSIRSGRSARSNRSKSSRILNTFSNRRSVALKEDWESLHQTHDSDMEETLSISHTPQGSTELPIRDSRASRLPPLTISASSQANSAPGSYRGRMSDSPGGSVRSSSASMTRGISSSASIISSSSAGHRSVKGKALSSAGSVNSHGFETDDDPYAEATPQQLRNEISQMQAERARVTEQFEQLIKKAQSRSVSSSSSSTVLPSSSRPQQPSTPSAPLVKSQKRLSTSSSIFSSKSSATTRGKSLAPPSFTPDLPLSRENGEAADEHHPPSAKEALHLSRKRDRVQQRYDTQLEFLKVKLQGAELRQSLRQ